MKVLKAAFLLLVVILFGCKDDSAPPPTLSPQASPTPPPAVAPIAVEAPDPPPPVPGAPAAEPTTPAAAPPEAPSESVTPESFNTALIGLQNGVDQFIQDTERKPKTLEEIKAAGYLDHIPKPPKGKKFVIDPNGFQVKEVNL